VITVRTIGRHIRYEFTLTVTAVICTRCICIIVVLSLLCDQSIRHTDKSTVSVRAAPTELTSFSCNSLNAPDRGRLRPRRCAGGCRSITHDVICDGLPHSNDAQHEPSLILSLREGRRVSAIRRDSRHKSIDRLQYPPSASRDTTAGTPVAHTVSHRSPSDSVDIGANTQYPRTFASVAAFRTQWVTPTACSHRYPGSQ
jgi:hypothetical protein